MRRLSQLSLFFGVLLAAQMAGGAQNSSASAPCTAAAWHAFDFWVGEWDAFDAADHTLSAHVRVTRILGGCALREEYQGTDGSSGESLSAWDAAHRVWRQNWVSSRGSLVALEGNLSHGSMVLSGPEAGSHAPDLVRGTWKAESGGVREIGERSTDGGHTWKPWFDLEFRPTARLQARAAR